MPKGLGKIEHRIYEKMPPWFQRFWVQYHVTVKQAFFVMLFVGVAIAGVEARNASDTADEANREISVFRQLTPCTPRVTDGPPIQPKKCAENWAAGFETLTAIQACRLLQKGATLIVIGGKPIPPVTCIPPHGKSGRKIQSEAEAGERTEEGAEGFRSNRGSAGVTNPTHGTQGAPEVNPDSGSGRDPSIDHSDNQNETGPQNKEPEDQSPSQNPSDVGGSNGSEDQETSDRDPGFDEETSVEPDAEPESKPDPDQATKSGLEETVDGVKKTVCEVNVLGIRVCFP